MWISHHPLSSENATPRAPRCQPANTPGVPDAFHYISGQTLISLAQTLLSSKHVYKVMISDEICSPDFPPLVNMFSHLRHFTPLLLSSHYVNTSGSFFSEWRFLPDRPAIAWYLPGSVAPVLYQQMSDCVGIIVRVGEKHTLPLQY